MRKLPNDKLFHSKYIKLYLSDLHRVYLSIMLNNIFGFSNSHNFENNHFSGKLLVQFAK